MKDTMDITSHLRHPYGVRSALDVSRDLPHKTGYDTNSWFFIGHFEDSGEIINYLFHVYTSPAPEGDGQVVTSSLAFTNETLGRHVSGVSVVPLTQTKITSDAFYLEVPLGVMSGELSSFSIQAQIPEGSIDLKLMSVGHVIHNAGTGIFPMLGLEVHQYSLPTLETSGHVVIDGRQYKAGGYSWFDRQWQNLAPGPDGKPLYGKWGWMDLNLSNGDRISLWTSVDAQNLERSWATVLHSDGHQSVVSVEPLTDGESNHWISPASGKRYPTEWTVRIPAFDAVLKIIPTIREQELVPTQVLAYYEAASTIRGTYKGKETTGYCYVELVGQWQ